MSGEQAWAAALVAAIAVTALALAVRHRRNLHRKASETLVRLGRAEKAVRLHSWDMR